jgi:hypothetical protein
MCFGEVAEYNTLGYSLETRFFRPEALPDIRSSTILLEGPVVSSQLACFRGRSILPQHIMGSPLRSEFGAAPVPSIPS